VSDLELAKVVANLTADRVAEIFTEKIETLRHELVEQIGHVKDELGAQILELDKRPKIVGTSERAPRVLVVDDHVGFAHALARQLEQFGMSASPSVTVEDAKRFLAGDPALEVALVDVEMPKNGRTMLEYILDEHPAIEAILMSGRIEPEQALDLGAFGFLEKPINMSTAVLTITRAAELRRAKLAAGRIR
jgi:CheY-like chemotaxis protein